MRVYDFEYTGEVPHQWRNYFANCKVGDIYKVLVRDDSFLVMCNTPYEYATNLEFIKLVVDKGPNADVLIYGYGIGYVLPFIKPFCNRIVIIEKHKEVLDQQDIDLDVEIVTGDCFKTLVDGSFDIIFSDVDVGAGFNMNHCLKKDGKRIQWNHLNRTL